MNKITFVNLINSYLNKIVINNLNSSSYISKIILNDYLNSLIYSTDLNKINQLKDDILSLLFEAFNIVVTVEYITI